MVRQLTRDTAWNVVGSLLPIAAGLWSFPQLLRSLPADAFGWLTLTWIVLGAGGLFDLGLGRALAREVSAGTSVVADRVRAGLELSLIVGAVLAIVGLFAGPAMAKWVGVGELPPRDVVIGLRILAVSVPAIVLFSALRGILEGEQRFALVNVIRGPSVAACFLFPLAAGSDFPSLVAASVAGRWLGCLAFVGILFVRYRASSSHATSAYAEGAVRVPEGHSDRWLHWRAMIFFGGAVTLTGAFALIMSQGDRVLVARVLGPAALAVWSPVFEVVSRVLLFPLGFVTALFPRMVSWKGSHDGGLRSLILSGLAIAGTLFVPLLAAFALTPEALELWLGEGLPSGVVSGARWLVVGVFFNAVAQVPFAYLQAVGRPGIPALLNGLELPVYAVALVLLLRSHGIAGAGIAWAMRSTVDAGLMYVAAIAEARR